MTTIAFTDTETLGLSLKRHPIWEIAVIRREPDGAETEHVWQIRPTWWQLHRAEPKALELNRYHERMAVPRGARAADMLAPGGPAPMTLRELRTAVHDVLNRAVMVGSNPPFDAARLARILGSEPWQYRVVDIATLAAGYRFGQAATGALGGDFAFASDRPTVPYKSRDLSRAVGVEPPGDDGHQALVDAKWAMAVHDAVTGGVA